MQKDREKPAEAQASTQESPANGGQEITSKTILKNNRAALLFCAAVIIAGLIYSFHVPSAPQTTPTASPQATPTQPARQLIVIPEVCINHTLANAQLVNDAMTSTREVLTLAKLCWNSEEETVADQLSPAENQDAQAKDSAKQDSKVKDVKSKEAKAQESKSQSQASKVSKGQEQTKAKDNAKATPDASPLPEEDMDNTTRLALLISSDHQLLKMAGSSIAPLPTSFKESLRQLDQLTAERFDQFPSECREMIDSLEHQLELIAFINKSHKFTKEQKVYIADTLLELSNLDAASIFCSLNRMFVLAQSPCVDTVFNKLTADMSLLCHEGVEWLKSPELVEQKNGEIALKQQELITNYAAFVKSITQEKKAAPSPAASGTPQQSPVPQASPATKGA